MKYTTEKFMQPCGCRSVGECGHNSFAEFRALDALVDSFAASLKLVLHRKALAGRHGWDNPRWPISEIQCQLGQHVHKAIQRAAEGDSRPNDLLDVAAFAMFWWNRNQPESAVPPASAEDGKVCGENQFHDTTKMVPPAHAYTSTACLHGRHDRCRRNCKYCDVACHCTCHNIAAVEPPAEEKSND